MSKIKTTCAISMAQLMDAYGNKTLLMLVEEFCRDILQFLPKDTTVILTTQIAYNGGLSAKFELTFDCPFFDEDFEFDVNYERKILCAGEKMHCYSIITDITPINLAKK